MNALAILGAGSWGTALAIALAPRFDTIRLWAHDPGLADQIRASRENTPYLPGFLLPPNVEPLEDLGHTLDNASIVLLVAPSQHLRAVLRRALPHLHAGMRFVSATKGIETGTLDRMSEIIRAECPFPARVATLSGPTFAREIANGEPAAVVIASPDDQLACCVQSAFSGPCLRLYTNGDQIGVELGGALKNVIAIGAGIVQGLGLGNNTIAALITRGLAEITRLSGAAGGEAKTLAGLAGLGDLVLTCTGDLSRNRRVGIELGKGHALTDILASTKMVAEGVETTYAAADLAAKLGVEMPIVSQMHAVLREGKPPRDAIRYLMDRQLRSE
ncbi:MAG TPA: NAD(P)H-dependent glycerol-3-phosphate dehydrogenase [Bryobacteraceae bacterium]|nr:NAD(P)H-dependent glycerol-3-phosphate dehydrogenase [Bryobacteraceae bacterium]